MLKLPYRARQIRTGYLLVFVAVAVVPVVVVAFVYGRTAPSMTLGGVVLGAVLSTWRTLVVDRAGGRLELRGLVSRRVALSLTGLTVCEVEIKGTLARLVLVYGDEHTPVTSSFFHNIDHHRSVARAVNEHLGLPCASST